MNEEQKEALEAKMVARFEVKDLSSAVGQKAISDALLAIQGVCETTIARGAIHVTYDPLHTNEAELKQAVEKTGHPISAAETALETPHPDLPPAGSGEAAT